MKWKDLCFIPGQEQSVIQILKYIVLRNLMGEVIYMDGVDLLPHHEWRWFFFRDKYQEYHFVDMPRGWDCRNHHVVSLPSCHHTDFHRIVYFLSGVFEGLVGDRWARLRQMIVQLRKEYDVYCRVCDQLQSQLCRLDPLCKDFLHAPFQETALPYIQQHCSYMKCLMDQTQQYRLLCDVLHASFEQVKDVYRTSILQGDSSAVIASFRREVIGRLYERRLSFLSFKDIDFGEWLACLLYMEESQQPMPDTTNADAMMYKLWVLLNLYFTERPIVGRPEGVRSFLFPCEELEFTTEEMDALLSVHPLERGLVLSS